MPSKNTECAITISRSEERLLREKGHKLSTVMGKGSFACVFKSYYIVAGGIELPMACKVIDSAQAPSNYSKKFLPRELAILAKINHPHIIHIHAILKLRYKYFIFMRLAETGDLLEYMVRLRKELSEYQAKVWLRQIALAIQYLHALNIAHRDVKLENILITVSLNAKLSDFGFSRSVLDPDTQEPVLSLTFCGSMAYAAPEIIRGYPYNPKRSDVWSLGCCLFAMLNRRMPFEDYNLKHLYDQQVSRKYKYKHHILRSLSMEVRKLIPRMLEPDANIRYTVDQVLLSPWIAEDSRIGGLTETEQLALDSALNPHTKDTDNIEDADEYYDDANDQLTNINDV